MNYLSRTVGSDWATEMQDCCTLLRINVQVMIMNLKGHQATQSDVQV